VNPQETVANVRRRLASSPAKVFAAFSDASLVSQWLRPSPEVALTVLRFDFRAGGAYRFAYHVPGRETMHVNGVFHVIDAPSSLVFSWNIEPPDEHAGLESEVTVTLTPDGAGTMLVIRHAQLTTPGSAARHAEGWSGAMDLLIEFLERTT
jgi:uncharacterized protein YndB with AHSA1/START domain